MARSRQIDFGGAAYQPAPQEVQRLQLAQALMQEGSSSAPVQSPLEGIARVGKAAYGGYMQRKEQESMQARERAYRNDMATLLQGASAKPWVNPDTGQQMGGPAGGLAGLLAASERVQTPQARQYATDAGLAAALEGGPQGAQPIKLGAGDVLFDPNTGQPVYSAPFAPKLLSPEEEAQQARLRAAGRAATNVNVNTGPTGIDYGDPPKDMAWARNQDGTIVLQSDPETGYSRPVAVPVAGGSVSREKAEAAEKAAARKAQEQMAGNVVIQDLGRSLELLESSDWTSGPRAAIASRIPGTPAYTLAKIGETVKSNITMDSLRKMRESSPTGGALGNVTEKEGERLAAAAGSLDLTLPKDELRANMQRIFNMYMDTVHGTPEQIKAAVEAGRVSQDDAGIISQRFDLPFDVVGSKKPDYSQEDLEFTARQHGISVDEVKRRLGIQ